MLELPGLEVVLPILIAQLKLRRAAVTQEPFSGIKFIKVLDTVRAGIITAFIDSDLRADFPDKQGMLTMGAVVFSFFSRKRMLMRNRWPQTLHRT